jgi:plastocyanin
MGRGIGAVVAVVALALPAAASADKQVDAAPPNRFTASEYTIDQGEKLVFHNGDTVSHDVTASDKGPDGKPLFNSPITDAGKTSTVNGAQYLTTGHYAFICSIHPNMQATLHVSANGTPQTRPGAAGPAGSTQTNSSDKTAPSLGVKLVSKRIKAVRQGHRLRVRVSVDEETHVVLKAIARPRVNGPLVTVAKAETHLQKGTKRVSVPLTAAGRKALRGKRGTLAVIVTAQAIDNAGNKTTERYGRTLRR